MQKQRLIYAVLVSLGLVVGAIFVIVIMNLSTPIISDTSAAVSTPAAPVTPHNIYFGTDGGGMRVYDTETGVARIVRNTSDYIRGLAYDPTNDQIYYSTQNELHRRSTDSFERVQTVFNITRYGPVYGLAVDWITGNLYGVSTTGQVFVCKEKILGGLLDCATLLTGQGVPVGIALNPNEGTMYWTHRIPGGIKKVEIDGSNAVQIATGLTYPAGIVVDHSIRKLFWVDDGTSKVQSSDLDGGNVKTIVQLSGNPRPFGIALLQGQIFWGNYGNQTLQSSSKSGEGVSTLYTGSTSIRHLLIADRNPPRTRQNHCEGHKCPNICILTLTHFRCLP